MKITLTFEGGSHVGTGSGFGSFAVLKGNQRTVTRLEFGSGMTGSEADYDTLIMALRALVRQESPSQVRLEIQTSNTGLMNAIKCPGEGEARMQNRVDQIAGLLQQFNSYQLVRTSKDKAAHLLRA
jgi:hypothetical protein